MKLGKYKLLATLFLQERFCYDNLGSASRHSEFISESTFGHSRESGNLGSWIPGQARNDAWRILKEMLGPGFSNTLSRLLSDKLVVKTQNQFQISNFKLQITYLGVNSLLSRFPLLDYLGHAGHEEFTLVVFNVPEEKRKLRDRLRYVLKTLSFGQINRSLYISPHLSVKEAQQLVNNQLPMTNFQTSSKGSPQAIVLSVPLSSFGRGEEARELLAGFWDLKETERLYERALAVWETASIQKIRPSDSSDDLSVPGILKASVGGRFLSLFLEALINDPLIPPSLLPKDWPGSRALELARKVLTQ